MKMVELELDRDPIDTVPVIYYKNASSIQTA